MTFKKFTALIANRSTTSLIALVFATGLLLAGAYLWSASARLAKAEVAELGHTLAKQTTFLLRPLLLADDRISINYLLQELQAADYVAGLQLTDRQGNVVGRSGAEEGVQIQRRMVQSEREIATLTLWLNPAPLHSTLHQLLLICLLIALIIFTAALMVLRYKTALDQPALHESPPADRPEPIFDATSAPAQPDADNDYEPSYDSDRTETDTGTASTAEPEAAPPATPPLVTPELTASSAAPPQPDAGAPAQFPPLRPTLTVYENPASAETSSATVPDADNARGRDEVQLDLYSFEHEMELLLTPEDAGYLLYIDTTTAHTEYADSELRADLLHTYQQLANQVAHIYSGEMIQLANGDMQILFATPQERDAHGVNAVCAGLLFTLLYRGYNKTRIGQFLPVLNFHTALVRGRHDKLALMLEEARFLTRTTQSNELISHTALTEAPDIKATLLKEADIRREDEDKVLIHKVKKRYQELFEKQANHLLIKLKQLQAAADTH